MSARPLPPRPNLEQYKKKAKELLKDWKSRGEKRTLADAQFAIAREHGFESWPKFAKQIKVLNGGTDIATVWRSAEAAVVAGDAETLERLLREHEKLLRTRKLQSTWLGGLTPQYSAGDARAIIASNHFFKDWNEFAAFSKALKNKKSAVQEFEQAVDAIVAGDTPVLKRALSNNPALIRARSTRTHHSTLLHYVGANGVEGFRQRTPKNAVEIAEILIKAGAEVDAPADMYGGGSTTLGLVATSVHPKVAGVQEALMETLLRHGARIDALGSGHAQSLVNGCLANGRQEASEFLASRGAPLDLEGAAGVGRIDVVKTFFNADGTLKKTATVAQLKDGFTWACEYGRTDVIEYLLGHGVSAGEVLPRPHRQTGLHWAAHGGHVDAVKALLKRRPPLEVRDAVFNATPLSWALHGGWREEKNPVRREGYYEVIALLVAAGAQPDEEWLKGEVAAANPRMVAAVTGKKWKG
jgi:hypothetical protein